jgi:uncharacterized protein YndB with AHSA1/START domain
MGTTESRSIHVATTPETLWQMLITTAGIPDWYDDWDAVEHDTDHGRLSEQATFRLIRRRGGHTQTAHCRVILLDPPHRLIWTEDSPPYPGNEVRFELERDPADDTVLTLTKTF